MMNTLKILPCLDSPELGRKRQVELLTSRDNAANLGATAVEATAHGYYLNSAHEKVDLSHFVQAACANKISIAQAYGHTHLVLGAWGCGAFGNDADRTARDFRHALEHEYRGAFAHVQFAITDWSPERRFLGPFRDVFTSDQ